MGIRRVQVTCQTGKEAAVAAAYDLLRDHSTVFDLTRGRGPDSEWIQFLSEDQNMPRTLSCLAERAGVGTEEALRVAISEVLTTVPPIQPVHEDRDKLPLSEMLAPRPRRTIHEIFMTINAGGQLTFDYLAMVTSAAMIAMVGLVTDSSVSVVASMLLSPLMSPILCITFGLATEHPTLIRRGLRTEVFGVALALAVGFASGAVMGTWYGPRHLGVHVWSDLGRTAWNSPELPFADLISNNVSWPYQLSSEQITSRGSAASLVSGTLIAIPSGFGAVIAITAGGGNALVGVAIAAALLPPLVNCGLCFGLALRWQTMDPNADWARDLIDFARHIFRGDGAGGVVAPAAPASPEPPLGAASTTTQSEQRNLTDAGAPTTIKIRTVDIDVFVVQPYGFGALGVGAAHAHPYIVVALHGFWSFILFASNFFGIVVVGGVTFRLKGISREAEDFPPYFPPPPRFGLCSVLGCLFALRRRLLRVSAAVGVSRCGSLHSGAHAALDSWAAGGGWGGGGGGWISQLCDVWEAGDPAPLDSRQAANDDDSMRTADASTREHEPRPSPRWPPKAVAAPRRVSALAWDGDIEVGSFAGGSSWPGSPGSVGAAELSLPRREVSEGQAVEERVQQAEVEHARARIGLS